MKTCSACGQEKPLSEFYKNPPHAKGYRTQCKQCLRAGWSEYQHRPEVIARRREQASRRPKRERVQAVWRANNYTLTSEREVEILAAQGGVCAICGSVAPGGQGTWHVDHDHTCCSGMRSCGKCIRGLLCARCNPMLGMARDSVETLEAAVTYLQSHALVSALDSPV